MRSQQRLAGVAVALVLMARSTLASDLVESQSPAQEPSVLMPEPLESSPVPYPSGAEGRERVVLELHIDASGGVVQAEVVSGREPFATVAREASLAQLFSPARVNGAPRAVKISFAVDFEPPTAAPPPASEQESATPQESAPSAPGPEHEPAKPQPPEEVAVVGSREAGNARVVSDSTSQLIVGAEGDPVRALQALPGAVPIFAASPFLGFRASPPGKIGYEYDGIRLPYLYHLGGLAAVVHPWMVDSASTYGAGPARLGQAVGGLFEARARQPSGRLRAEARVRSTESSAGVEAPFAGGKGSVLLAGRYSYMQPLVGLVAPDFRLDYWDYQARVSLPLSTRDTLEVLALGGGDITQQIQEDDSVEDAFHGSFHRTRLAWTHQGDGGQVMRWSALYSHDRWDAVPDQERPRSNSMTLRGELSTPVSRVSSFDLGVEGTYRAQYDESEVSAAGESFEVVSFLRDDLDFAAWGEWIYGPTPDFTLTLGLRADALWSGDSPASDAALGVSVGPRQSLAYRVLPNVLIHQSVGLQSQRRSPSQRTPGRFYSTSGGLERSLLADAGVELRLPLALTLDLTGFAGVLFNVGDVETLIDLEGQPADLERGQGRLAGLEVSLTRSFGRHLRGLFSYTLSRAERSIGVALAPARFDRTHVLNLAANYDFGRGWSLGSRVLYYSGFPGQMSSVDEAAAPPRSTPYVQVDVQGEKRWDLGRNGAFIALTVGLLNAGFRKDSTSLDCRSGTCEENLVGPATLPTLGVTGSL